MEFGDTSMLSDLTWWTICKVVANGNLGDRQEVSGEVPPSWRLMLTDRSEEGLADLIDEAEVGRRPAEYAFGIESCSLCCIDLSERALALDGRIRGKAMWMHMCARCFQRSGAGLGCGCGQLYARQPNGSWRLVAGFTDNGSDRT